MYGSSLPYCGAGRRREQEWGLFEAHAREPTTNASKIERRPFWDTHFLQYWESLTHEAAVGLGSGDPRSPSSLDAPPREVRVGVVRPVSPLEGLEELRKVIPRPV